MTGITTYMMWWFCVVLVLVCLGKFVDGTGEVPGLQNAVTKEDVTQAFKQHFFYLQDYTSSMEQEFLDESINEFIHGLIRSRNGSRLDALCINQTLNVMKAATQGQLWALQVVDSFGKPESGLLTGNIRWRGSYKECTQIKNQGMYQMDGKYCTAVFTNSSRNITKPSHSSVEELFAVVNFQMGICVPKACTENLLETLLTGALSVFPAYTESQYKVLIDCQLSSKSLDYPAIVMIVIMSVVGWLLLTSTVYDVYVYQPSMVEPKEERNGYIKNHIPDTEHQADDAPLIKESTQPGTCTRLFLCFSLYTNGAKILNTDLHKDTIPVLHGIRFLSLTWVIISHVFGFVLYFVSNAIEFPSYAKTWSFQVILNTVVAVDTFLLLSGLLVSYMMLKNLSKKKTIWKNNWLLFYFRRFWRLTPAYMIVIGICVAVFKYLGSGPAWPAEGYDYKKCSRYWWRNLLYIQNFFPGIDMCMDWSWYLAIDMQYYLLSPFLVLPYLRSKWLGLTVTGLFILVQIIATVVVVIQHHLPSGFANFVGSFTREDIAVHSVLDFGDKLYFKPWVRFGPYGVGIVTGYILFAFDRNIKMSRAVVVLGWTVAAAVALVVVYGTYEPAQGHLMTPAASAVYQALHSTAWSLAVAWVIIACDSGHGGFVNTLLSWKLFAPVSRLTYMAYLIHPVIIFWYYFNQQRAIYYTNINSAFNYVAFLVFSYAVAFVGCLAFEAPMVAMERVLSGRKEKI